jgi:hypothetical protein
VASGRRDQPRRADGGELHEAAQRWWEAWSQTPQAAVFTDSEWERLAETALLVDRYWRSEDASEHLELIREITRREEAELGYTGPLARRESSGPQKGAP